MESLIQCGIILFGKFKYAHQYAGEHTHAALVPVLLDFPFTAVALG